MSARSPADAGAEPQAAHDAPEAHGSPGAHSCPLCGGPARFAFTAEDRNRRITAERFSYHRCRECSSVFLASPPRDLGRYYGGGYHQFDADGQPLWRGDPGLLAAEAWRVQTLRAIVGGGTLIDVGAGAGGFAAAARDGGFEVSAIEMDGACCELMQRELGVRAICTDRPLETLSTLPPARVVSFWHVLEHLPDPAAALAAANDALEPGGVLAIAVPNPDSIQFKLLRSRWAHLDAPRHVCLMGAGALEERARELGLEPVLKTTSDPSGLACNVHGWVYALRNDPSSGAAPYAALRAGVLLAQALAPVERRGCRGAALTLLLRKPS
jgi:2-polyprenyl-3-methyl-5-hydroxy-6-metoxy-1,4-benzoquinol methylase